MPNWNGLAEKAKVINSECKHTEFDQMLLSCVISLLDSALSDEAKKEHLSSLLLIRWKVIAQTSMDYTFNPQHPTSQLYLAIAEKIAADQRLVCQLLMPSVNKIIGTGFSPEDVESASLDIDDQFILPHFLTHARGDALISVLDVFEYGAENTDRLFPSETRSEEFFDLTAADRERIRLIAGEASQRYFEALEKIHRVRHKQKPSIGWALKEFITALLKSSKMSSGTEYLANVLELKNPILKFYQVWNTLTYPIKNRIKNYQVNGASLSLESYLLCIFVHAKEHNPEISITEYEFMRVMREKIVPCTYQIGLQLDSLLKQHPDLFDIPAPGMEALFEKEALPDKNNIRELSENLQCALRTHSAILGVNDDHIHQYLPIAEIIAKSMLKGGIGVGDIEALVALVKNYKNLTSVLVLLPDKFWDLFFTMLRFESDIERIFQCDTEERAGESIDVFAYLLTHLPLNQWKALFDVLYNNAYEDVFNSACLGGLFSQLPENQWPFLNEAVSCFRDALFNDADDILNFLCEIEITDAKKIIVFYQDKFNRILQDPRELGYLFSQINVNFWHILHDTFRSVIRNILIRYPSYEMILEQLDFASINFFVMNIYADLDFLSDNPKVLARLLLLTYFSEWVHVFEDMGETRFLKLVRCENTLIAFLMEFIRPYDREQCIYAMQKHLSLIKMSPTGLNLLLMTFPENNEALIKAFTEKLYFFLSFKNISAHCKTLLEPGDPMLRKQFCDTALSLNRKMKAIENDVHCKRITPVKACHIKLELLDRFLKTTDSIKSNNALRKELIAYFGEYFFNNALYHVQQFERKSDMRFFKKQTVKAKNVEKHQSSRDHASLLVPISPGTDPERNPSFIARGTRFFTHTNTRIDRTNAAPAGFFI